MSANLRHDTGRAPLVVGLRERLDAIGVRTYELLYCNRFGQQIWHELRGTDAGHAMPQFSIQRGVLQAVLRDAVVDRLRPDAINTSRLRRLVGFAQDVDGVTAHFADPSGAPAETARGIALIGADGIHSTVRASLVPDEGPPRWNGTTLWRGAADWPMFLTGRSMIIAGGMQAKLVVYPIARGSAADRRLTNWTVMAKTGAEGTPPPRREDWSRPGRLDEVSPPVRRFSIGEVDVMSLIQSTPAFWEYPVCDRDPLRLPMGQPHGRFNRSGATVLCLFWVTPAGRLYDLFAAIEALEDQTPDAVVAPAGAHEVDFLPPPRSDLPCAGGASAATDVQRRFGVIESAP